MTKDHAHTLERHESILRAWVTILAAGVCVLSYVCVFVVLVRGRRRGLPLKKARAPPPKSPP